MKITREGNSGLVETDKMAYTYSVIENPRDLEELRTREEDFNWSMYGQWVFNDFIIHPFGTSNNLPAKIRNVIQQNYLAPGLLTKKKLLLWGKGPKLYREYFNDKGELMYEWKSEQDQESKPIYEWLERWDYTTYLEECITSYQYMHGVFSKPVRNKGGRIGNSFINKVEHVPHNICRMATYSPNHKKLLEYNKPTHAIVTDFRLLQPSHLLEPKIYPLFNRAQPFKHKQSISYSKLSTFLQDVYTLPDIYGALEWLKRSTAIPLILKALSKNSINIKYHIESPMGYWSQLEEDLKEECTLKGKPYSKRLLKEKEKEIFEEITKVLSDEKNVGKFMHTKKILEVDGTHLLEHGWTIKEIPQNVKDFVKAQIEISNRADYATSAAINIHSALGNISESGKSDSGSEQLYAYMIYLSTANDLPEMIITKTLNEVIRVNFNTDLRIGFYHEKPQKQQDVTKSQRLEEKIK